MSRRKQLRPFRVQDDDDSNANQSKSAHNGRSMSSNDQGADGAQISNEAETIHKNVAEPIASIGRFLAAKNEDEECQDSANNNKNRNDCEKMDSENASQEHLTLHALEKTKIAIAQFAAAALSKGTNENSAKDLTMLQSALFTLQHQQVFQMQLIEQLQYQLAKTATKTDKKRENDSQANLKKDETPTDVQKDEENIDPVFAGIPKKCESIPKNEEKIESDDQEQKHESKADTQFEGKTEPNIDSPDCNISSTLASNIITNHAPNSLSDGTNSLMLLQKRAEEVLDSATQSFTTGNLIDELSYRTGAFFNDGPSDDPSMKHRCRFCGKIFGSDSALQIHLRSHTGERPFECRVCGSRFTTKGNLKVHYQRHTETMDFGDEAKKELRIPYDFRATIKSKPFVDKPFPDETFDLSSKKEEKNDHLNDLNETRSSQASESPKRFDDETARHFLTFDQEYSSSKKKAWEKYMEIVDTPKATELQQDEAYRVDPNKCPICNRLLSCRSALRQHYRTHTGERPFKCRLCARSFTTKGNLKTHIGVHKINPLLSPVHTCTICSKKYSTAHALQQHINTHTGAPIEMTIDQIRAAEVRDFVSKESISDLYGSNSSLNDYNETSTRDSSIDFDTQPKNADVDRSKKAKAIDLSDSEDSRSRSKRTSQDIEKEIEKFRKNFVYSESPEPKRRCSETDSKSSKIDSPRGIDFFSKFSPVFGSSSVPLNSSSRVLGGSINSLIAANSYSSMGFSTGVRGNTTCNICFKTLACHSALEIHYRSHTKEKPYLCQLCNRGFSTKGNMKQHYLTHKIRDMPQHVFRNSTQSPSSDSNKSLSALGFQTQSQPAETALMHDDTDQRLKASESKEKDNELAAVAVTDQSDPTYLSSDESGSMSSPIQTKNGANDSINSIEIGADDDAIKNDTFSSVTQHKSKSPAKIEPENETSNGVPRRQKVRDANRDYCKICSKHFGSASALETHMRSHTGAKPFNCSVCEKSFSTKGNLKVHMQAHSWPNETNRNTHRQPLDMPNHFPQMNPYGLHRPADLFNPFIANAAALQQKLHEANLYQKYVNASNMREFTADILKNNDEQTLHRNLFGLAHLPFQMFNDHIDRGSMKNK